MPVLSSLPRIFSVEGNIGSGKSTFVEHLKNWYSTFGGNTKVIFLKEPVKTWDSIKDAKGENIIEKFYKDSQYGAHKDTALKIFKEYPIFGVGIKNFRYESGKPKYFNKEYTVSDRRQATHPHQIHLEFLSETGLFGYISFLIFILSSVIISTKNYFKNKNVFQLSGIIYIFSTLIPLLPSGSFLSTFNSSIFWINFAIMVAFYKDLKLNHN